MSELNAILNIEDKRPLSLYENENFDQLIQSTTKLNLATKTQTILCEEL